jgi:hypothetical protein
VCLPENCLYNSVPKSSELIASGVTTLYFAEHQTENMAGGRGCFRQLCSCAPWVTLLLLANVLWQTHAVKVRVWTNVTDAEFVYPELDPRSDFGIDMLLDKPSVGISMSGGGWRAASLAYGWLRALHLVSCMLHANWQGHYGAMALGMLSSSSSSMQRSIAADTTEVTFRNRTSDAVLKQWCLCSIDSSSTVVLQKAPQLALPAHSTPALPASGSSHGQLKDSKLSSIHNHEHAYSSVPF